MCKECQADPPRRLANISRGDQKISNKGKIEKKVEMKTTFSRLIGLTVFDKFSFGVTEKSSESNIRGKFTLSQKFHVVGKR